MTRRWLGSADVEIDPTTGALLVMGVLGGGVTMTPPSSLAGGTKTIASAGTVEPLVSSSTPCRFVWVGARVAEDGTPQNAGVCFLGDSAEQHIPIMTANYEGAVIRIDDASKLHLRTTNDGDGVVYHLFA